MDRRVTLALPLALAACAHGPSDGAADEAAIRAALAASQAGWNRGDLDAFTALYAPDVTAMTPQGPREGLAAVKAAYAPTFAGPMPTLGVDRVTLRRLTADSALMTGRYALTPTAKPTQQGWFTLIWLRTPQGWRAVHDHTG